LELFVYIAQMPQMSLMSSSTSIFQIPELKIKKGFEHKTLHHFRQNIFWVIPKLVFKGHHKMKLGLIPTLASPIVCKLSW